MIWFLVLPIDIENICPPYMECLASYIRDRVFIEIYRVGEFWFAKIWIDMNVILDLSTGTRHCSPALLMFPIAQSNLPKLAVNIRSLYRRIYY